MGYYCCVCDKTIRNKSKNKNFRSRTQNELTQFIRINHTMENLDFFDNDGLFNDHITNHNKRLEFYLISGVSKLVFDEEFYHHIKSELKSSVAKLRFKRFFLFRIE